MLLDNSALIQLKITNYILKYTDLNKKSDHSFSQYEFVNLFFNLTKIQISGNFGRQVMSHSLTLLSKLLEDRTNKLKEQLNRLVGGPQSLNISDATSIENLYEDLHWLVLIAGHVLCMESDGEVPLVPSEIMRYSMEQV